MVYCTGCWHPTSRPATSRNVEDAPTAFRAAERPEPDETMEVPEIDVKVEQAETPATGKDPETDRINTGDLPDFAGDSDLADEDKPEDKPETMEGDFQAG